MKQDTIEAAIREAKKFVRRADVVLKTANEDSLLLYGGSSLTGALRRQSMELTRALAEMRKR